MMATATAAIWPAMFFHAGSSRLLFVEISGCGRAHICNSSRILGPVWRNTCQNSCLTFRKLRVPASSANLGPAFDALALALGVYLECRFRPADQLSIHADGRDAESISSGEDNLIWHTAVRIAGDMERTMPPIELAHR